MAAPSEIVNGVLYVPCIYTVHDEAFYTCWGRGECSTHGCDDEVLRTDGKRVTWRKSDRYQILGNITGGDLSLTITGATNQDEGTYCCNVEVSGWGNGLKTDVEVRIQDAQIPDEHPTTTTEEDMFTMIEECPDDPE
ncbi:hepatitis A virus cellular receptor 1 homolog [Dendropsophus ebraccatus]|uniref:hepatitis A virus cellular receptor 1 homolog n=1 Tax=Dendropsophus ebraccatus TaxID=150705 RepID=UPI0038320CEA